MIKKADSFLSSYTSKPYTPVHFGATQIARKKLSPMKPSLLKNNETNMLPSENKDAKSIDHYKHHHLCYFPRLTKKTEKSKLKCSIPVTHDNKKELINFIKRNGWSVDYLTAP